MIEILSIAFSYICCAYTLTTLYEDRKHDRRLNEDDVAWLDATWKDRHQRLFGKDWTEGW